MRKFFEFAVISILLALSYTISPAQDFAEGRLIVKFNNSISTSTTQKGSISTGIQSIDKLNEKYSVNQATELFKGYVSKAKTVTVKGKAIEIPSLSNTYVLTLDESADILSAVKEYGKIPEVMYAEPDYIAHACATPNDSFYNEQWGLFKVQASDAWDIETGDTNVIVGILDTGIDTAHSDIINNLWINTDEIPDNSTDDDVNGYVDDVYGWNFVDNNNNPNDGAGHGTHCAGIAGAVTDNNKGVAGVSWNSKLMAVKVLNNNGVGLYSNIALGIVYAAANNAKVINMSLGGYANSTLLENAVINAYATSVLVGAAGNDGKEQLFYPACFDEVLAVAATDSNDIKWDGSNYGSWVDLSAPGVSIYNTTRLNNYARYTGTSMAAPFVSGVAALIAAYKPVFSTGAIMNFIVNNTEPIDTLNPTYAGKIGRGRLNANLAINGDSLPILAVFADTIKDPTGDNDGVPDITETVNLVLVLQNNGMDATGISTILHTDDIDITISDSTANFSNVLAREKVSNSGDLFTFSISDTCPQHNALFKLYVATNGGSYNDTIDLYIGTSNTKDETGLIAVNTTWKKGTHIVKGNVTVNTGITLTIDPGAEIRLDSAKTITIRGVLNALGTAVDSIIFTKNKTKRWGTLDFKTGAKGSFAYCRIEYAGNTGIYFESADSLNITNSKISYNIGNMGGGIFNSAGLLFVTNSIISNNSTSAGGASGGAGILIFSAGSATVTNTIISDNTSSIFGGGGICCLGALNLSNSEIYRNSASNGGGIWFESGSITITNNIIYNNYGTSGGGGICTGGNATISKNTICNNIAPNGGAIWNSSNLTIAIINNTIIDTTNSAIYVASGSCGVHSNNILTAHYAVYNNTNTDVPADSNWWNTNTAAKIDSLIYDINDDGNLGLVNYTPILTSPLRSLPPYLDSIKVYPEPVGVETLYLYLTFSKNMDTTVAPKVLFAIPETLLVDTLGHRAIVLDTIKGYKVNGTWVDLMHWNGKYFINEMIVDSTYTIGVSDARDDSFPFPIPMDIRATFRVYTAGSASRELTAQAGANKITLSWHPSKVPNVLGYNLYRSTTSGGPYDTLNTAIINDTTYVDTTTPHGVLCYYVYTILDNNFNESSYSSEASALVGVEENPIPKVFAFSSIYPNPFIQSTLIKYQLPVTSKVSLKVYDLTGRQVCALIDRQEKPGYYTFAWDGKNERGMELASGIYFCRLETPEHKVTKKLTLLR